MKREKESFLERVKNLWGKFCFILGVLPTIIMILVTTILLLKFFGLTQIEQKSGLIFLIVTVFLCILVYLYVDNKFEIKRKNILEYLGYFNIFDSLFIIIIFSTFKTIEQLFNSEVKLTLLLASVSLVRILIFVKYKNSHAEIQEEGKTYASHILIMFLISFATLAMYLLPLDRYFNNNYMFFPFIFVCLILITISNIFLYCRFKSVEKGPESVVSIILKVLFYGGIILLVFLIYLFENEIITILTWFLPVLLPVFIGEINSQIDSIKYKKIPEQTTKMKNHLYQLQLFTFNILLFLNLSLLKIGGISIKEKITSWMVGLSENRWLDRTDVEGTRITFFLAVVFGMLFSSGLLFILKKIYLDEMKGYFKFKREAIKCRKYHNKKYPSRRFTNRI